MSFLSILLCLAGVAKAQTPAVDPASFMNLRFYEANGGFMVEHLQGANLESGQPGALEVAGKTIPLREQTFGMQGFSFLEPNGPGVIMIGKPGNYELRVSAGGQVIGRHAFTMQQHNGQYVREGAWRKMAFFAQRTQEPESPVGFHFWASLRELPAAKSRAMLTVQVMAGGRQVAATRSPVVLTIADWQFFRVDLEQSKTKMLTAAMLGANDGEYQAVLKADGQPLKTYSFRVRGGRIEGAAGWPARRVDTSSGSNSSFRMTDTYWVEAK